MANAETKKRTRTSAKLMLQLLRDVTLDPGTEGAQDTQTFIDGAVLKATDKADARKEVLALVRKNPEAYQGLKARIVAIKDSFPINLKTDVSLG